MLRNPCKKCPEYTEWCNLNCPYRSKYNKEKTLMKKVCAKLHIGVINGRFFKRDWDSRTAN